MIYTEDDEQSSGGLTPQKDYVILGNNVYERVNKRPEDVIKDILRKNEEASVGNNVGNTPLDNNHARHEERFHFVHPEIEEEEAWRIHDSVKRLVTYQKIPEICIYIKEQRERRKMLLPQSPSAAYKELQRMGMPKGEGFGEKYFSSYYMK